MGASKVMFMFAFRARKKKWLFFFKPKEQGCFLLPQNGGLPIYKHFRENFTPPHLYVRQHFMVE